MLLLLLTILNNATKTSTPFENFWNVNITDCIIAGSTAIALIFGIYTARKWQRRQTEIADKQYQLNAFLEIFERIDDPDHTAARKLLDQVNTNPYQREFYQTNFDIVRRTFDMMGMLYNQNSVPQKMLLENYWYMIIKSWDNLRPYIQDIRNNADLPLFAKPFETLYDAAIEFKKKHYDQIIDTMTNVPRQPLDKRDLDRHVPTFDTKK